MSLLRWFSRKKPAAEAAPSSSLPRGENTRPSALAMSRRTERMARRELLYQVVREAMVRAGVLSSSYRFKVLSLDGRGLQFLVMIDLTGAPGGNTAELAKVEAMMAQAAKAQYGIFVKAVYWREKPPAGALATPQPPVAQPAAAETAAPSFEPLQDEEIAAFRQALASGVDRPAARAFDGAPVHGPQSYTLLTGFEDTEAPPEKRPPALSTSQYGELR
jgi:hypothetical protein